MKHEAKSPSGKRPAGRGPLESLYFDYPIFAAPRAPELDGANSTHPVVIAGAGPIGMTAALTLARYGVRSVLVDRKETFNDGSRATCIARPSMQIFESIGAIQPFLDKALGWRFGRSYYRGEQIYRLEMPHPPGEKYLPMYNLQQQYVEKFLHDAIARSPLIDMRWQTEVTSVAQNAGLATLSLSSPHGDYALNAEYVLAADGARSPMRSMLGLRLRGENYEGKYVIADVRMEHDFPTERRAFFEAKSNPGGTILIHKQPDNIWRLDYQLKDGENEDEAIREDTIRARAGAILAEIGHKGPWDLEWWSIYSANTLLLDEYKHGRVIFIGDSAHIVPIFGVRGLNNGLADAFNIGWKLGLVLGQGADPELLASYSPERRGATLDVFANAKKSTRFMTPPSRGWRLAREAALSLSLKHEFPRGLANPRQMQPYTYAESPLTPFADRDSAFAAGPQSGAAAPNPALADGTHLLDKAGLGMTIIGFGDIGDAALRGLHAELSVLDDKLTVLNAPASGPVAGAFGADDGTIYVLRPDLHVGGRWMSVEKDEIVQTVKRVLGKSKS